jgi:hypothetical protein
MIFQDLTLIITSIHKKESSYQSNSTLAKNKYITIKATGIDGGKALNCRSIFV